MFTASVHKAEDKKGGGGLGGMSRLIQTLPLGINASSSVTAFHDNRDGSFFPPLFFGLLARCPPTQFLNYAENVKNTK